MEDEVAGGTGYLCSGVSPLPMHGWISKRRGRANGKCVTRRSSACLYYWKGPMAS